MLKNGRKSEPTVEYIPARDYYHRHQRAYFWEVAHGLPIGNNVIVRYLFGWMYPFNFQLMKRVGNSITPAKLRDRVAASLQHVLQDFMVPMSKLEDILKLSHEEFQVSQRFFNSDTKDINVLKLPLTYLQVYPIWLCPCRYFHHPGLAHLPKDSDEMYIDIGIYGLSPKKGDFDVETKIRKMEKFTTECKG